MATNAVRRVFALHGAHRQSKRDRCDGGLVITKLTAEVDSRLLPCRVFTLKRPIISRDLRKEDAEELTSCDRAIEPLNITCQLGCQSHLM